MSKSWNLISSLLKPPKMGQVGPLELLVLQPTTFCNLNCDYCYLPSRSSTKRMSREVIEASFKRVFESGLVDREFTVVWHAGEPLVVGIPYYEEALSIIDSLKPRGVKVTQSFQTNGTLLNDDWCQFIKLHDFKIGLSIDGPEFLHDLHRKTRSGRGTHAKVMEGAGLLKKHGIGFHTISVLSQDALGYPDEVHQFFTQNQISHFGFNVEEKEGANAHSTLEQAGTETRLANFMSRFYALSSQFKGTQKVREFERFEQAVLGWSPLRTKVMRYVGTQETSPFKIISVDWEGNFSTFSPELLGLKSDHYGSFSFGNVLSDSIESALTTKAFERVSNDIQSGVEACEKTCDYYSVCGGGSPANKLFENKSFNTTETMHCRLHVKTISNVVMTDLEKSFQKVSPA